MYVNICIRYSIFQNIGKYSSPFIHFFKIRRDYVPHLFNKRGGWNKLVGGAKVAKSLNVEAGINVEGGIFWKN